jgi:hypothetical protein
MLMRGGARGATGSHHTAVTPDTESASSSYDVDAALMHIELHERGIHALRPRADEASVADVRFQPYAAARGET